MGYTCELSDNKGINLKGGGLSAEALTDKDRQDIRVAAELGADRRELGALRQAVEELVRFDGVVAEVLDLVRRHQARDIDAEGRGRLGEVAEDHRREEGVTGADVVDGGRRW